MEILTGIEVSDEILGTFMPILAYWVYSGIYVLLGSLDDYRLHTKKEEDEKNLVSKKDVVKGVLLQQAVQAVVATILFAVSVFFFSVLRYVCIYVWRSMVIDMHLENFILRKKILQSQMVRDAG